MQYISGGEIGRIFTVRLDPGDFVLESINEFIKKEKISDGVIVSGIGTLDNCTYHMVMTTGFPPVDKFFEVKDTPMELSALSGIIADGMPHIHMAFSDPEREYTGHLENGCRVLYLCEIVIMELKGMNLTRITNSKNIKELTQKK
jgi:uncharacterized protein